MWGYVRDWVEAILQDGVEEGECVDTIAANISRVLDLLRERVRDAR